MKKKILLITHDAFEHRAIIKSMKDDGYDVLTMALYGNMLAIIREETPALVILDTDPLNPGSLELAQAVKTDKTLQKIPVLLIIDFLHDYILKPVEPKIIQTKVRTLIGTAAATGEKKKVVIIDDEVDLCKTLSYRFEKWGYAVKTAHDGKNGFALIQKEFPDLVILDLHLPLLSGEEVCKRIRKADHLEHIPIIMLTAKKNEVDRIIGKVIGANEYITKPFEIKELFSKVSALVGQ
jgi:DNA-binding response OmpR family regulator